LTGNRIMVVDDEAAIVRVLRPSLVAAGYVVTSAATGERALAQLAQDAPDLVILDLGLPDMDGKDIITLMREWTEAPIIVLSARHDEAERISALDMGANDFVTKPFHMGELQARVRAALRHHERRHTAMSKLTTRGLKVDFERRRVTLEDEELRLTRKEFDLLRTLAQHAGQVVTHKQLLAAGWGGSVTDTQFVRVYIGQLRQKIEADPSTPRLIITEPGVGYRLVLDEDEAIT
jgi:two-component system KDP operon response regulator KdpE